MPTSKPPATIDEYIDAFPPDVQQRLQQVRTIIRKAAPMATERISYGMPAFAIGKPIMWFGGFKNHVGFYPGAGAIRDFKKQLAPYRSAKGSVQFPHDQPLPSQLITQIVKYNLLQPPGRRGAKSA